MNLPATPLRSRPLARGLLLRAALLVAFYGLCQAAGLREYTGFLSGTHPGTLAPLPSALLGLIYLVAYLGATLLAPILLLAAGFLGLGRLARHYLRITKIDPAG